MDFSVDHKLHQKLRKIIKKLHFYHLDESRIICFRSYGSKARAYARIWSLPTIWQKALKVKAHYCLEVISDKFDRLNNHDQIRVLIHELLHIPKNFSGSLLPHGGRRKLLINNKTVNKFYEKYQQQR